MSVSSLVSTSVEALLAPRLEQRIVPGLERMHHALASLGNPEKAFPAVLVVGTNGKGSTAVLLASILQAHGLRVGLYTSPHLVRVEERIQINQGLISGQALADLVSKLAAFPELSYFETLTVAAFQHFATEKIDLAILEAGLGGRWDATNAKQPMISLLTNVGTDHQQWLGSTRAAIAGEKAAALRGLEGIVSEWDSEVEAVIRTSADPATPLSLAGDWAIVNKASKGRVAFAVPPTSGYATLPLQGTFQKTNLQLALAGLAALTRHGLLQSLDADAITKGIAQTMWPGRLQWIDLAGHRILLDGAHNREAMTTLAGELDWQKLSGKIHLLFSCLEDKPLDVMAALLQPRVTGVTLCRLDSPRTTSDEALLAAFPDAFLFPTVADAVANLPSGCPILATGSLRLVGEILRLAEAPHD